MEGVGRPRDRRVALRRREDRRRILRSATAYFIVLLVLFVGAFVYQRINDARIVTAAHATCERLNILRVKEANRNAQVVWAALYRAEQRERILAKRSGDVHDQSADYLRSSIDAMRWTPETDCRQAVRHPATYTPPRPMRFGPRFLDFKRVPK